MRSPPAVLLLSLAQFTAAARAEPTEPTEPGGRAQRWWTDTPPGNASAPAEFNASGADGSTIWPIETSVALREQP